LEKMNSTVESDLRSLLSYYGESVASADAPKPEDFFGLVMSFSSALQKAALEVYDAQPKSGPSTIQSPRKNSLQAPSVNSTVITKDKISSPSNMLMPPSQGQVALQKSVGKGDLDEAIRSMRGGKRRERPNRPLSKIFLDGGRPQSRIFD